MQSRAMKLNSDILRHDQKCKNMKRSQDMQLIQKLRDDQKRMKKVFEVMSGRNIVTNSRVTPSWREIVSLTFSEAGILHVVEELLEEEMLVSSSKHWLMVMWSEVGDLVVVKGGLKKLSLVDGVFEGAFGALEALEMEALVDAMEVYGG
ncbi:hypothetical protein Tco_0451822 [Tanacetum coccineum]